MHARICVLQWLLKRSLIPQLNNFTETLVLTPHPQKESWKMYFRVIGMSLRHTFHELTVAIGYYEMFRYQIIRVHRGVIPEVEDKQEEENTEPMDPAQIDLLVAHIFY